MPIEQIQLYMLLQSLIFIIKMTTIYIPKEKQYTLKEFQYTGGTDSITYKYLWSPFAEFLLKFFPMWVAPNLITFLAFLLLLLTHIIFMLPDKDDMVPDWKMVMMSISILIYQHLDNIDGKQARRTKSSSPLGMLFDHGSDAISAFLISAQVLKIMGVSFQFRIFALYSFVMLIYFCAMWSQYSVGYFKLGVVNPVDEGLPVYAIACLIATQMDITILRSYHIYGTYSQQLVYGLMILLLFQFLFMSKEILGNFNKPISQVLFMPLLYILAGISLYILYKLQPVVDQYLYLCVLYSIIAMWARNMILIQLQFITKQKYRVFNRGTNFFLAMTGIFMISKSWMIIPEIISPHIFFLVWGIIQVIILLQFCVNVMKQGARILKIQVFSLKPANKTQ